MENTEKLVDAVGILRRYEVYCLLKAWGAVIIVVGIAYFLTSWTLISPLYSLSRYILLLHGIPCDDACESQIFQRIQIARLFILIVNAIFLFVIMLTTFLSITKTSTKNQEIVVSRMRFFGIVLLILFVFTFHNYYIEGIGLLIFNIWVLVWTNILVRLFFVYVSIYAAVVPLYLPGMLAIFFAYLLLRKEMKDYDFKEVRRLGYSLLFLCIIDISWRAIIFASFFPYIFSPAVHMIYFNSYFVFDVIALLLYIISGLNSLMKANQVLEGSHEKKGLSREGLDETGETALE